MMMSANDSPREFDQLLTIMVEESADAREARMREVIGSWTPETLLQNADELSDAIQTRVVAVQSAAIEEHNQGNDTTAAQKELQALVDMMVYSKILVRDLKVSKLEDKFKDS